MCCVLNTDDSKWTDRGWLFVSSVCPYCGSKVRMLVGYMTERLTSFDQLSSCTQIDIFWKEEEEAKKREEEKWVG